LTPRDQHIITQHPAFRSARSNKHRCICTNRRESDDYANLKTVKTDAKIWLKNLVHFHPWGYDAIEDDVDVHHLDVAIEQTTVRAR
jgi:hypothetical protein